MGTAATKAKTKFEKENYDQVKFRVKKGVREEYREKAKLAGYEDFSKFIIEAIEEKIEKMSNKS